MTDVRWDVRFKDATHGSPVNPAAGPWRPLLDPGQLAAEDLAAIEVLHYLRFDPVLFSVFEGRLERVEGVPVADQRKLPRCLVYLASAASTERPTSVAVEAVSVFVGACWALETIKPLADGAASIATTLAHVKRVLRAPKSRTLTVYWQGKEVSLSTGENAGVVQVAGPLLTPLTDLEGRHNGIIHEIEFRYSIHTDRDTMRIVNLS